MEPIVITMDTKLNQDAIRFLNSMTNHNWKYRLLGTDQDWVSFLNRANRYRKELRSIADHDPNQVCVISDCRDVICVRTPDAFISAFNSFQKSIIVSAEIVCGGHIHPNTDGNCYPLTNYWENLGYTEETMPIRKYVNAGLICGTANALYSMYEWMIQKGLEIQESDDQYLMGKFINEHHELVAVDHEAEILHTTTFAPSCGYLHEFQQYDSPTVAEMLGRRAFFLHIPGANQGKGNGIVYKMVSAMMDTGYTNKDMLDIYEQPNEWPWKAYVNKYKK